MLYPMFVMVLLTLFVGLITVKARFMSIKNREISMKYYQLMQGDNIPNAITLSTRCFNNMFEVPVMFYVAATLYLVLGIESTTGLVLAWAFVILRVIQAFIHLGYNNVIHRLIVFWLGFFTAISIWVNLLVLHS
ncbi:MAG: MAPEG family protein [Bermanella sp.]